MLLPTGEDLDQAGDKFLCGLDPRLFSVDPTSGVARAIDLGGTRRIVYRIIRRPIL